MSNEKTALCLMFDRPLEPLIMPKGDKEPYEFDLPDIYLTKRHRSLRKKIKERFEKKGARRIHIKNISLPDLSIPLSISKNDNFSVFFPKHNKAAGNFIDTLMRERTIQDFISLAAYCRDKLNPCLFNYCLSVAMLHRKDTNGMAVPNFLHSFPDRFVNSTTLCMAREEATIIPDDCRKAVVIPKYFTANSCEPEQKLAYFREDIGINLHHWHWHLVYPFEASELSIVDKDRRGELFYYMHEQIIARYNVERFCNDMPRVKSFSNLRENMNEGYFPKLDSLNSARIWAPRLKDVKLNDIDRPEEEFVQKLEDLEVWIKNINEAIEQGYAIDEEGNKIPLNNPQGIDIVGNMVEASIMSPNKKLYGNLHNMGHVMIAVCHDPDFRFNESFAAMGDTATAMRDPIFYRWHGYVNDLMMTHKNKLPYYTRNQLDYPGITMTSLTMSVTNKNSNELYTFWEQSDVDLSRGLDFAARGPAMIRLTHLQHQPFTYIIKVKNSSSDQMKGTMRLFMAPKYDEREEMLTFEEQKWLMMEMDKFTVTLIPGNNKIIRQSDESSVTIPYELTFRSLENIESENPEMVKYKFCGCGWPDHVAIPKGTKNGFAMQLFAMVSNYSNDEVNQEESSEFCSGAESYCGRFNMKYPDQQNMGYPFDRKPKHGVCYLPDFLTPNMMIQDVTIFHTDKTVVRDTKKYEVTYVPKIKTEEPAPAEPPIDFSKDTSSSNQII